MNLHPLFAAVWQSDLFLARLTVGLGSLYWAVALLIGDPHFDRPAYVYFAAIASQQIWGGAFLLVSVFQLFRVFAGTPLHHGWLACLVAAGITSLWWAATLSLAFALYPSPSANAGNLAVSVLASLIFFRTLAGRG